MSQGYYEPNEGSEWYMQETRIVCGYQVLRFPQKPDYLPITEEEFRRETLAAWSRGRYREKIAAVIYGGEQEWEALYKDENMEVRGAVACRASEEYQLKLVNEPISAIRDLLAIYGTDKVRLALLERGESNEDVLQSIAKFGSTAIRHRFVDTVWDRPTLLMKCTPYLPAGCIEKLMGHPDTDVQVKAALYGTIDHCGQALMVPRSINNLLATFLRPYLLKRIAELDEVAWSIHFGKSIHLDKTKTRKYETMEL